MTFEAEVKRSEIGLDLACDDDDNELNPARVGRRSVVQVALNSTYPLALTRTFSRSASTSAELAARLTKVGMLVVAAAMMSLASRGPS